MSCIYRGLAAIALAIAAATPMALAQSRPSPVDAISIPDIPYTRFVLPNGLTLLVHEDHKAPIVAVNTWYHVGSKNEKPGKTGFAHLFEHLMFSGSENLNQVYLTAMGRAGATSLNGTTSNDRTNYFQNVPTSMLDYALFAESDRMGHFLGVLDQKKLDLQRGVVQNEKRQRENQPYGLAYEMIVENTYPRGHPYSWTVIGSMQDLDAASMPDVQEWFKAHYGPNNVTLVIAGDVTPEVARQKVEKFYGDIPPGPPLARQGSWIAKRTGTHRGWAQDRVPQARLYRTWNVPQFGAPEEALLDLAAQVMGGGKTSRLYRRLVYKDQIATGATAENDANEIGGQLDFTLTAKPGQDLARVEAAANEELQRFLKEGPTEEELQLAKMRILSNALRVVERVGGFGGKSDLLARCQTFTGNPGCYKEHLRRVREATPAQVRKAAVDWLSDGDYVLEIHPFPTSLTASAKVERSQPPAPGLAEKLTLPPMQRATLANGLKVVLAERHNAPVVNFSLHVASGFSADAPELPGVASLSLRMLDEGTKSRDALGIGRELEALGATFNAGTNLDWASANFNVLKATMPQGLELFADLVLNPAFASADFERLQRERIAAIRREKVSPDAMAMRVLPALVYGQGHPYALPLTGTGTEASVAKMTRDDLARFHGTWFKPNNAVLLVVGDTTMAEVKPRLEALFGKWAAAPVPQNALPQARGAGKPTVYLIDRPGAQQSTIVAALLAPPRNNPDDIATQVMNNIFGSSFASRINMNLREDKHWSYGVRSAVPDARGQRMFYSSSPVQADKTADAMKELISEYRKIAGASPITANEVREAQDRLTLTLPGNFETSSQLAAAYRAILEYGLPDDYYDTFTQKVLAVTPQSANALATRLVTPDALTWVVVGDMSKIEAGVRALNLGEVRRIDPDGKPLG